jgi:hypothetical protein
LWILSRVSFRSIMKINLITSFMEFLLIDVGRLPSMQSLPLCFFTAFY